MRAQLPPELGIGFGMRCAQLHPELAICLATGRSEGIKEEEREEEMRRKEEKEEVKK
jgi:hypothetical protein